MNITEDEHLANLNSIANKTDKKPYRPLEPHETEHLINIGHVHAKGPKKGKLTEAGRSAQFDLKLKQKQRWAEEDKASAARGWTDEPNQKSEPTTSLARLSQQLVEVVELRKSADCPTCSGRGTDNHLADLYHTARTALSNKPADQRTDYHRKVWASQAFAKEHPGTSATQAYKMLDRQSAPPVVASSKKPAAKVAMTDDFKRKMGVCMEPGCAKIDRHDGGHTPPR